MNSVYFFSLVGLAGRLNNGPARLLLLSYFFVKIKEREGEKL